MPDIKLIFLGTGNAFNTGGLANNSLLIQYKYGSLLFDAGPTSFYQMLKLGFFPEICRYIHFS